jgi:WD40 repeat protein
VAISGDGRLLASASWDGTVRLWHAQKAALLATLEEHTGGTWDVALSADGRLLATASRDGRVRLCDVADMRTVAMLEGHTGLVHSVSLSADGGCWPAPAGMGQCDSGMCASHRLSAVGYSRGDALALETLRLGLRVGAGCWRHCRAA